MEKVTCDTVNLLKKARNRVNRKWCKNDLYANGAVCLLGSLGIRYNDEDGEEPYKGLGLNAPGVKQASKLIADAIPESFFRGKYTKRKDGNPDALIPWFNDDEHTTKKDVLTVLDMALLKAIDEVENGKGAKP